MLKQTCTYVFEKYIKYKQLCGNSQELFQTFAIIFSKESLVSINEMKAGIFFFFLVLVIVQHGCQDMFTLRVGKISTMLGTWTQKKSRAKQEKKKKKRLGKKSVHYFLFFLFSFNVSLSKHCFHESLMLGQLYTEK